MDYADQAIPVYTNLTDVFGGIGVSLQNIERWNGLAQEFERRFGRKPSYIARAPGRVNLIGEHIDYALFGVLPAAVEPDILIACGPTSTTTSGSGSVVAENLHGKYSRQEFSPTVRGRSADDTTHVEEWHLDINTKELRWESYVKAGYYGVLQHYFPSSKGTVETGPVPVDLLVTGSVPAGSGLSSSAAMVVASTLAFLAVNDKLGHGPERPSTLTKGQLVKMAMENEKRVGVNSGGMDQAASVMSDPASALYISFYPALKASPASLPPGVVFVIANSLVISDKAVTAKTNYNLRVVETLVAAQVLARTFGVEVGQERITLREVVGKYSGETPGNWLSVEKLATALEDVLEKLDVLKAREGSRSGVTMEEMVEMSGLAPDAFHRIYLSWIDVKATHFELYKRAKHVFSEALRVLQFRQVCLESQDSTEGDAAGYRRKLGDLMNESQESCAELFNCSCPEIDQLTKLARSAGAIGSRLTGKWAQGSDFKRR